MSQIAMHSRFWDGSEPGWVVIRHSEDHCIVSLDFGELGARSNDIQAIRLVSKEWAKVSAAQALSQLKGKKKVVLGSFESAAARRLVSLCESRQLSVTTEAKQVTNLSFFNEITKRFALIEDQQLSQNIAKEAIAHGIPVRQSTV